MDALGHGEIKVGSIDGGHGIVGINQTLFQLARTPTRRQSDVNIERLTATMLRVVIGAILILLTFRLAFKLLGANPLNDFVDFIYIMSQPFLVFFSGISQGVSPGVHAKMIIEPATIVAAVTYGFAVKTIDHFIHFAKNLDH